MTQERKAWWRKVVVATVGGSVVAGGLFSLLRATAEPATPANHEQTWTKPATPSSPATPSIAEVERSNTHNENIALVSASQPVPSPVAPALPIVPSVPVPSVPLPAVPVPSGIEPVSGPRIPDVNIPVPNHIAIPPVPALPSVEPPKLPATPAKPDVTPLTPPLPSVPVAPPMALPLPTPAPVKPTLPMPPIPEPPAIPLPTGITPTAPPVKPADIVPPVTPIKPDSNLNPVVPPSTLNPLPPVLPGNLLPLPGVNTAQPIVPQPPLPGGREVPGTTVDRPKPTEPSFGASDKFIFPVPEKYNPLDLTPRDPAMFKFNHSAALAVIAGAMLTAEQAKSAALVPFPPYVPPTVPVRADDKVETEKLKKELEEANKKIATLEKQVAKLTELLTGKKDELGIPLPSDPGAVAEIKRLNDQLKAMEKELNALKAQTSSLKPSVTPPAPEVKPKGIVKVVNEYPVEISMVINEKSHRIAPNTKIEVEVPAGEFSYQLLQSGAAATRSVIKDKETVTLRIK
jgi:hypothetical protein